MWVWPFSHLQHSFELLRAHFDAHALTYRNTSTRLEARRSNKLWKRTIQRKASSCRGREKAALEPKALLFIFFAPRTSRSLLSFSAPLPGAWIYPSIELRSEVSNSAADINQNRALGAASIRHRAHSWDFWRRDITAQQRNCKPEQANRENSRPARLLAASPSDSSLIIRWTSTRGIKHLYFSPKPPLPSHLSLSRLSSACEDKLNERRRAPWICLISSSLIQPDPFNFDQLAGASRRRKTRSSRSQIVSQALQVLYNGSGAANGSGGERGV